MSIFDILDLINFYRGNLCCSTDSTDIRNVIEYIFSNNKYCSINPIQQTNTTMFIPINS